MICVIVCKDDGVAGSPHLVWIHQPIDDGAVFWADIDEDKTTIGQVNNRTIALAYIKEICCEAGHGTKAPLRDGGSGNRQNSINSDWLIVTAKLDESGEKFSFVEEIKSGGEFAWDVAECAIMPLHAEYIPDSQ